MAIYHCQVKLVKRSAGRSMTAAAAYRSGTRIEDTRTGEIHDYTRKRDVDHTALLVPEQAPGWMQERDVLWNAVEGVEKRKDAQLAREVEVALPCELDREQQQTLVKTFAQDQFVNQGMVADIAFHHIGGSNPHAHILLTMREVDEDGFGKKNRAWNERALVGQWRERWGDAVNRSLERAGHEQRVDHRSLKDQGLERLPTRHLGPAAHSMEKRGISTERGDLNRVIEAANRFQAKSRDVVQQLDAQIIDLEQERVQRLWEELKTPGQRYAEPLLECDSLQSLADAYQANRKAIYQDQTLDAEDKQAVHRDLRQAFRQMKPGLVTKDAGLILLAHGPEVIKDAYEEAFQQERALVAQRADRILERVNRDIYKLEQLGTQHDQREPAYPSGLLKRFREKAHLEWRMMKQKLKQRMNQLQDRWARVSNYRVRHVAYDHRPGDRLAEQRLQRYSPALTRAKQEVDRIQEQEVQRERDKKLEASLAREKTRERRIELGLPPRRKRSRGLER